MKKLFWSLLLLFALFACQKGPSFVIEGTISNAQTNTIYLEKLELQGAVPYDSARINSDGRFKLKGKVSYPTFFLLKLNANKFITLLLDSAEKVTFSADFLSFSNDYKIEGSFGSSKVQELNQQFSRTLIRIDSINSLISLNRDSWDFNRNLKLWEEEKLEIYAEQAEFSKNFIMQNPFSLASVLAIYQRYDDESYVMQDLQTIKTAASALHTMYPQSPYTQALYEDTKNMMKNVQNIKLRQLIDAYGRNSPDIVLPDINGKDVALSSFEGKYVLLHFWSANDRDSRIQNPVLKENYTKFKGKGFEIYQVSIDTVKNEWLQAVNEDQLTWTNVSDMEGSYTALANYNVRAIPANFLLDREGKVVAKDLKGPALHRLLSEILN